MTDQTHAVTGQNRALMLLDLMLDGRRDEAEVMLGTVPEDELPEIVTGALCLATTVARRHSSAEHVRELIAIMLTEGGN